MVLNVFRIAGASPAAAWLIPPLRCAIHHVDTEMAANSSRSGFLAFGEYPNLAAQDDPAQRTIHPPPRPSETTTTQPNVLVTTVANIPQSCSGISFKSQALYLFVYVTRYLGTLRTALPSQGQPADANKQPVQTFSRPRVYTTWPLKSCSSDPRDTSSTS